MSIRMVAVEFYRVIRQIEELEKKLENPDVGPQERDEICNRLRGARAQRDRLQKMIEGAKGA